LKAEAILFTSRSVLQGTKISYDSSLKVWNDYIAIKHAGVVDEFMINLSIDEKQLIIVGFLSYMYQKGYRGGKIKKAFKWCETVFQPSSTFYLRIQQRLCEASDKGRKV
jgi:hypothetical protein